MEKHLTRIALFAALIAALGLLPKLTLTSGIPITAQSMGIMLAGTILGARNGALSVLLFLFLVALGLPLLAGGRGELPARDPEAQRDVPAADGGPVAGREDAHARDGSL